jgi:type I restriction enzyme S subunit
MEVKPGYKQTEVGVIPENWEVKPLGDVVDFLDGRRRPVKDSDRAKMRGDIPYYGASGIVDYVNSFLFDEELILLGEDGENILSRNCRLAFKICGKSWVNNHAHVLRPKAGISLDYLAEFLESRDYAQYNSGTAQPKLNKFVCTGIPVLCPPHPEQSAIATALNDADTLLDSLSQLIDKKRGLKQATMQQLLTGKTRLPGFHGKWRVRELSEVCTKIQDGTHFSPKLGGNDFLYVTSKNIGFSTFDVSTAEMIDATEHAKIYKRCDVKKGDLLLTKDGANTGNCALNPLDEPFSLLSSVAFLRFDLRQQVPSFFLYHILSGEGQRQIADLMSGNAITRLTLAKIKALRFAVASFEEQTAIAEVLSGMDAELAALEQRREKTRALKQAMMQELLTGKTRLV